MRGTQSGLIMAVLGTAVIFLSTQAFAESVKGEGAKEHRKAMKLELTKELGLTEQQQTQLDENRKANQTEMQELIKSLKTAHSALREELAKYKADQAKIQSLTAAVKEAQNKMVDQRVTSVNKIKEILTAEQFQKLQEKAKERKEKMKKNGKKHGKFRSPEQKGPETPLE